MTNTIIHQGHTKRLSGSLSSTDTLTANGGNATHEGAHLVIKTAYLSAGTMLLDDGARYAGPGATLTDSGVLDSTGQITIGNYGPGGSALLLVTTGSDLVTSGTLSVHGGMPQPDGSAGGGGVLVNRGVLSNTGHLYVGGGRGNTVAGPEATGGTLKDIGTLTNSNYLILYGGNGAPYGGSVGLGGLIDVTGLLTNSYIIRMRGVSNTYTAQNPDSNATLSVSGTLTNTAIIEVFHGFGFNDGFYGAAGGVIDVSGTLNNSGHIELDGGGNGQRAAGAGSILNNSGVLTNSGVITLYDGDSRQYSLYAGQGATLTDSGILTNQLTGVIYTSSYYGTGYGANIAVTASGTLINDGDITLYSLSSAKGATLNNEGTLTNAGTLTAFGATFYGGQVLDKGSLTNTGSIILYSEHSFNPGANATLLVSGELTNSGAVIAKRGYQSTGDAAVIVKATGTLQNSGTLSGYGTLTNHGIVTDGGGTTGDIGFDQIHNDKMIIVGTGDALRIDGPISADSGSLGTLAIASGGSLTLNGLVDNSQTASLGGTGALLVLGDAASFAGTIDNFTTGETIDLAKLIATSASSSGTLLDVGLSTGTTLSFTLGTPLDAGLSLTLTPDGNSGTDITLVPASVSETGRLHQDFAPSHGAATGFVTREPSAFLFDPHRQSEFSGLILNLLHHAI